MEHADEATTSQIEHQIDYKTPKKTSSIIESEALLAKINILTTRPENQSQNAKVNDYDLQLCHTRWHSVTLSPSSTYTQALIHLYTPFLQLPTIKDFVIIKPISRGAFGKVFLGYKQNDSNKLFAIKVMRKSEMINKNMVSQVITERNALALSRSQFCVNLFYSLQSMSSVYLVMEYMVGGDLKSLLAMYGYFDEATARFYVAEMVMALQYLHQHGIVHRDIKPDNMLISATGHVKLTDFGLSKIEMRRDLEISDLINCSPNLNARTPGQLLSLTSHLSFGSEKKVQDYGSLSCVPMPLIGTGTSNLMQAINKHSLVMESSDSEADTSLNDAEKTSDSKISGVSPFFSAEEVNVSITHTCTTNTNVIFEIICLCHS